MREALSFVVLSALLKGTLEASPHCQNTFALGLEPRAIYLSAQFPNQ